MRQLELRHLRCIASVAKHLHFSRAADELEIAAPSLTRQIQEAERLLGVRLFHRTKRSVALTAAGEAYLADITPALEHLANHDLDTLMHRTEAAHRLPQYATIRSRRNVTDFNAAQFAALCERGTLGTAREVLERRRDIREISFAGGGQRH
jgi:hypothetical protein